MRRVTAISRYEKLGDPYIRVRLSDGRVMYEHRFLVECAIGRRLFRTEIVHHKDENPRNNVLRNLELKTRSTHSKTHAKKKLAVKCVCPICGRKFERTQKYVRNKKKQGQLYFFCGRRCRIAGKSLGVIPVGAHGKRVGYTYWGCRCSECAMAQRKYMKKYRSQKITA